MLAVQEQTAMAVVGLDLQAALPSHPPQVALAGKGT